MPAAPTTVRYFSATLGDTSTERGCAKGNAHTKWRWRDARRRSRVASGGLL